MTRQTDGDSVVNKDLTLKAKAKAKDSTFVLEDSSRPRTKAKGNNTGQRPVHCSVVGRVCLSVEGATWSAPDCPSDCPMTPYHHCHGGLHHQPVTSLALADHSVLLLR